MKVRPLESILHVRSPETAGVRLLQRLLYVAGYGAEMKWEKFGDDGSYGVGTTRAVAALGVVEGVPSDGTTVGRDLADRLISLFRHDGGLRRPAAGTGGLARFEQHADWRDLPAFYEYFHGDTGGGLGAAHQTGWTALVADLILSRPVRRGTPLGAGPPGSSSS